MCCSNEVRAKISYKTFEQSELLLQEIIQAGGKAELPQIKIEADVLDRLTSSYQQAMSETKRQIHAEIDTKVKKSLEIKRRLKSKPRKHNT